jgi:hypothetical protein
MGVAREGDAVFVRVWCELRPDDVGGGFNSIVVEFVCRWVV